MKTCPHCNSHNISIFDADNDICRDCGEYFPAVKNQCLNCKKCIQENLDWCDECFMLIRISNDISFFKSIKNCKRYIK